MEKVHKFRILIVLHGKLTPKEAHAGEGAGFAFVRNAVSIEEVSEFSFKNVF